MRVGKNPNRHEPVAKVPDVVMAAIVHLPSEEGYHEHRFEVVTKSLLAMRGAPGADAGVYIWDNGSCERMRAWLIEEYKPDMLTLSPNVGKLTARAAIVNALPPDTVVSVADDDMYYRPGWLRASLEVLETYPPSVVTAYPTHALFKWATKGTRAWAEQNASVEYGYKMPKQWHLDYYESVGGEYADEKVAEQLLIDYRGVRAWGTAHHCQLAARAGDIASLCQRSNNGTDPERPFDDDIDKAGLLRLATFGRFARHIGNVMGDQLRQEFDDNYQG